MENLEMLKCMTVDKMVKVVSNLSDVDTALDIINKIELEWAGDKLQLKNNENKEPFMDIIIPKNVVVRIFLNGNQ
jgi:hypothetical protein